MAISFMADNNVPISCSRDGAMYNLFAGGNNCVIGGIGNELEVGHNSASRIVSCGTGEGIICGRHINVTGSDTSLTLPANTTGYVVLRYDLSQSGNNIVKFVSTTILEDDNLNDSGTKNDLVLGEYTTSASGVSAFTDMRNVLSSIPASYTSPIHYGTTEPVHPFGNVGDIYILYSE